MHESLVRRATAASWPSGEHRLHRRLRRRVPYGLTGKFDIGRCFTAARNSGKPDLIPCIYGLVALFLIAHLGVDVYNLS
jgi:hypothetical protein